jgi:hypothetical protein
MKRQWIILINRSRLDGMENSEIFKTMKRQWNIPITGSWLDSMENSEIFKTMKRQWNIPITGWSVLDGEQWDFLKFTVYSCNFGSSDKHEYITKSMRCTFKFCLPWHCVFWIDPSWTVVNPFGHWVHFVWPLFGW